MVHTHSPISSLDYSQISTFRKFCPKFDGIKSQSNLGQNCGQRPGTRPRIESKTSFHERVCPYREKGVAHEKVKCGRGRSPQALLDLDKRAHISRSQSLSSLGFNGMLGLFYNSKKVSSHCAVLCCHPGCRASFKCGAGCWNVSQFVAVCCSALRCRQAQRALF